MASDAVSVLYLWCRECPSHEEGLALLHRVAGQAGVPVAVIAREVTTDAQAERLRFPGSPTYLVAGVDIADAPAGTPFQADACRAYAQPDGRVGPLPHPADLAAALIRAGAATTPDPGGPA